MKLSSDQQQIIVQAIHDAEEKTSGEIRVVIEKYCRTEVLERAAHYFKKLDMHHTELKNGVLMYVATDDHQLAIIGDEGINEVVSSDFWESTRDLMIDYFKKDDLVNGLKKGIGSAGIQLAKYFPSKGDGKDELPNDIVFGDNE